MDNPTQPSKMKTPLIILVVLVVLFGGGFALWKVFKKPDEDKEEVLTTTVEQPPLTGRKDLSNETKLSPDVIAFLKKQADNSFNAPPKPKDPKEPPPPPIYVKGDKAKQLIAAKAVKLQANTQIMDLVRAKYDVGRALISMGSNAQKAIDSMMGKVAGVDLTTNPSKRYLTFPVYGTHETRGAELLRQLKAILTKDPKGFNLGHNRAANNPWWLSIVSVNLLVGSSRANTPSANDVAWSAAPRAEIDFFKDLNGLEDKSDVQLVDDKTGSQVWWYAGNLFNFIRLWVNAIEHLDKVTEWEAIRTLTAPIANGGNGWLFTYIDPDSGADHEDDYDPNDSGTDDEKDPVFKP